VTRATFRWRSKYHGNASIPAKRRGPAALHARGYDKSEERCISLQPEFARVDQNYLRLSAIHSNRSIHCVSSKQLGQFGA
jgi:hypothetical protein